MFLAICSLNDEDVPVDSIQLSHWVQGLAQEKFSEHLNGKHLLSSSPYVIQKKCKYSGCFSGDDGDIYMK